ncbi:triphosphoribosyl-dephospho-CoA synthase [Methylobacterium oryzihabitans]|uniref:Triphosphoribosyl-dephospho-CoA synthase n=1 Tax=Methylobacterium oryzihabitans TaxID=2499852 RepID=A0A3S2V9N2_9HYPH|nr:triphosphoribosyl-dephospho-CoA synthase [Methylobacterium oryzihabitans]RVU17830.1 triphosphoribosyl-dephospho-CoA synthase [Methylobacterium oryzihabitans]
MRALAPPEIRAAYEAACRAELDALKPGNVHAYAAGHRMTLDDFVRSAAVSGPHLAAPGAGTGARAEAAVAATLAAVGQNTNLGIVLLCAPLAAAAERPGALRRALAAVLDGLDAADAAGIFSAIRRANPGGLGAAARHDVTRLDGEAPLPSVAAAMAEAADRDRIARAYVTGYRDLYRVGLPALRAARARGLGPAWATSAVYLAYLAAFPDSHLVRKFGSAVAGQVRMMAAGIVAGLDLADEPVAALMAFDAALKADGCNPGTSADLTVATLFLDALDAAKAGPGRAGARQAAQKS